MIRNYLKIAIRNLWKHKLFSFINIFGLAVGMIVCILAIIETNKAFNYDRFHPHEELTYRIITDMWGKEQQHEIYASAPMPTAAALKKSYDFIDAAVKVIPARNVIFTADEKTLPAPGFFADADFFKIFGFKFKEGVFSNEQNTTVLNEFSAKKFFGNKNPIGQVLVHKDWGKFVVTGVLKNNYQKSHLQFDVLISSATLLSLEKSGKINPTSENWTDPWGAYTYILVKKGTAKNAITNMMAPLSEKASSNIQSNSPYKKISFRAQNLSNINPSREDMINFPAGTTLGKLLVQLGIGLLTLFLAGFNYVNLTLARSLTRSKEIGVRKVIGAMRWQVFLQFITESILMSVLALFFAVLLLEGMRSFTVFQNMLLELQWTASLLLLLLAFSGLTGFIAGYVPARILSAVKPALVIKGHKVLTVLKGITLRKVLVVAQFAISLTGIIVMMVMFRQQLFMAKGEYGFEKDNVLNISLKEKDHRKLANQLTSIPGVENVAPASFKLGFHGGDNTKIYRKEQPFYSSAEILNADQQFVSMMKLTIVAGENLPVQTNDSTGSLVLVNEKTAEALHFSSAAEMVGKQIWLHDSVPLQVTGVVKDFHSMSMFFPIFPLVIRYDPSNFSVLHLKINQGADKDAVMAAAEKEWKKINPYETFEAKWFDADLYERHFHAEDQWMFGLICGLVLSIACLGLLGMVTFSSEIRTKEVGIRKTLGANVGQLLVLLSKDFFTLLIFAGLIALPAGYILSTLFLNNFAFHVTIGAGVLLVSFFGLLILGASTISMQTYKIAIHNPVESLKEN